MKYLITVFIISVFSLVYGHTVYPLEKRLAEEEQGSKAGWSMAEAHAACITGPWVSNVDIVLEDVHFSKTGGSNLVGLYQKGVQYLHVRGKVVETHGKGFESIIPPLPIHVGLRMTLGTDESVKCQKLQEDGVGDFHFMQPVIEPMPQIFKLEADPKQLIYEQDENNNVIKCEGFQGTRSSVEYSSYQPKEGMCEYRDFILKRIDERLQLDKSLMFELK